MRDFIAASEVERVSLAGQGLPYDRPPESPTEFRRLDPRVISVWRLSQLIGWTVILTLTLIAALSIGLALRPLFPLVLAGWAILVVLSIWMIIWYPRLAYERWFYRVDREIIEVRRGIVFQVWKLVPLTRLQHVDLHRGPIERAFGLAKVLMHTAGTVNATIGIPGLDVGVAQQLRDYLVEVGGDDAV